MIICPLISCWSRSILRVPIQSEWGLKGVRILQENNYHRCLISVVFAVRQSSSTQDCHIWNMLICHNLWCEEFEDGSWVMSKGCKQKVQCILFIMKKIVRGWGFALILLVDKHVRNNCTFRSAYISPVQGQPKSTYLYHCISGLIPLISVMPHLNLQNLVTFYQNSCENIDGSE